MSTAGEQPAESPRAGWKRAAINAFIVLHLCIMLVWGMPGSHFRNTLARFVEGYVIKIGLWHSWDMFSPDPLAVNFNLEAHIYFQDGTIRIWEFPRMEKLGLGERYRKERFRKWRERVRQDIYSVIWEDTARYVARLNNDGKNPPKRVVLVRHWGPIPPPQPGDYQPIAREYEMKLNFRFAFYDVKPEDL